MKISRVLTLLILLPFAAAAEEKAAAPSRLAKLLERVSNYLNSDPVRHSKVTAVAAVRGGIPTDQGEDLDQRLLDRAFALRARLLSEAPAEADRASLREVYRALALSQWVQAAEIKDLPEARASVQKWAKAKHSPAPSEKLASYLSGETSELSGKNLVDNEWGAYCRSFGDAKAAAPDNGARAFDAETSKIDEALHDVQKSYLERKLASGEAAQAHFLAGSLYAELAATPLMGVAVEGERRAARHSVALAAPEHVAAASGDASASRFSARTIYDKAAPGVALIICSSEDGSGELGSGSLIDAAGQVLTNAHVVIRDSTGQPWPKIRVYFKPAKMTGDSHADMQNPIGATVAAYDRALDLALLKLEQAPASRPVLALADPDSVSVGDQVAAIGHPEQGGLWTLTTGVLSTVMADLGGVPGKNAFQTDASINRGNSGGPLLNASGDIVGVNTSMSRKAADGLAITSVNFALQSSVARRWLTGRAEMKLAAAPSAAEPAPAPAPIPETKAPAAPPAAPARPKPQTITESKPYTIERLIDQEIHEMENLESEMHQEVLKRKDQINEQH